MMSTNYYLKSAVFLLLLLLVFSKQASVSAQQIKKPGKGSAGLKDYFTNPVLGGDYPDPSVVRDGKDYYMTHSSFEYYPGLLIWHSTDLIHWERVAYALNQNVGSVWAPDLIKHKGHFYIYFPANKTIWVVTAQSP